MKASSYLNRMKLLTYEGLVEIEGFGPIIAKNIIDYISNPEFDLLIQEYIDLESSDKGLNIVIPEFRKM